jgi:hypothetical protein
MNVQELVKRSTASNPKENIEKSLLENFTGLDVPANPFVIRTVGKCGGDLLTIVYSIASDREWTSTILITNNIIIPVTLSLPCSPRQMYTNAYKSDVLRSLFCLVARLMHVGWK